MTSSVNFFATMRGQAMHEKGVIGGQSQVELGIDLEALELGDALVMLVLVAHGSPGVGDDHVGTGNRLSADR